MYRGGRLVIISGMWDWLDLLDFIPDGGRPWVRVLVLLIVVAIIAVSIYLAVT